ncbi:MAG: prephenate dehydratase [Petroclostridium sp.]|jgi:prephenate dehydratase|uniref:prephenate dehydratase n=1 Tax=Petroclostridium xylanilyticum TaxID=1792311 RepID=UPI000B996D0C|nr:prephenate dehydratase [Petroclostridium xylanilyticum]MBZ4646732.1 Prephenate dehydratase [Clostridia bacterium]MDK2811272.1 prephenate dehydratase [Petroclostridium sp.]
MKIGYLGPRGTFSQQAAEIYVKGMEAEIAQYTNIAELILAVNDRKVDEAVVPIENSIEGAVNTTLDMLAWDVDLTIKKEIVIPITHNLMVRKEGSNISLILSHPQAIGQCREFLNRHFPNTPVQYTYSTAQAAQQVASANEGWAAIAAQKAAEEYDLKIIYESIQDTDSNVTRFIVLSHQCSEKTGSDKTSIIFSTDNKPGSLYRILQILNLWDINMTKIESRPAKNSLGNYIFFVDIEGHWQDDDVRDALTMIKRKTSFFKMLGSYPANVIDN